MAIAGGAQSSVQLTLIDGRMVKGAVMMRQSSVMLHTPQLAWKRLLEKGECYMALQGNNLLILHTLYEQWKSANATTGTVGV